MLSYLSNVLLGFLLRLMVTDLTQILTWSNVGSELRYLLDSQSSETVRTHSLFLFDLDLEKGFLNISAQNHWSKSCSNQDFLQSFLRDDQFSRQSLREYPDSDLVEASYTTLNFVDPAFSLITGLYDTKNSFGFSL